MSFSLQIFLYVFYGFLAVWSVFFLTALYHLFRFGFKNLVTILSFLIFVGVAVLMLSASFGFISQIDWSQEVAIFNGVAIPEITF